ncbi:mitochondrial antiviral-signaling protein isoform X2 [Engystomops pustulosus]
MMGFAEDKFMDYLKKNVTKLKGVNIEELLPHMTCLTDATLEKLHTYVRNQGNRSSVLDFYLNLRGDNWVPTFINALRECGHEELSNTFLEVYSSYLLPKSDHSPHSLPPSLGHNNRQQRQENPQSSSNLQVQMSPPHQDPQPNLLPKPSQKFNQIQPEEEMNRSSWSNQDHEFRSLPAFPTYNPPPPPGTSPSHNVSSPQHSDSGTLEDYTQCRNPIPETSPCQTAAPEVNVDPLQKDETSVSDHPRVAPDPLPGHRLPPSQPAPRTEVPGYPTPGDVPPATVPETRISVPYIPSTSSDSGVESSSESVQLKTEKISEQTPAYISVRSGPDHGRYEQQRDHPVTPRVAAPVPSRVVAGGQRNGQTDEDVPDSHPRHNPGDREGAGGGASGERPANQQDEDVPDSHPSHHRGDREGAGGGASRERPANQQFPTGSSCRPLDNNSEEEYLSKPGVLTSTLGLGHVGDEGGELSPMSGPVVLEISDCTETGESNNVNVRPSPSSMTRGKAPSRSTPSNQDMKTQDRRSPEENDYTYSPVRTGRPVQSSSHQPEENSYGSKSVSHFNLQFSEEPGVDLMGGNDDALRSRARKNTREADEPKTKEEDSGRQEGRDRERMVLITITAASLCLSLYLFWKIRQH